MNQTVVGLFNDPSAAKDAVRELMIHGFTRSEIDISLDRSLQNDARISDFFTALFGSSQSQNYSELARRSSAIITVHTASEREARRAAEILDETGAVDMDEQAQGLKVNAAEAEIPRREAADPASAAPVPWPSIRQQRTEEPACQPESVPVRTDSRQGSIPIIEENLKIGKETVETGRVKLHSKIIEQPVEEHVRLREEHIVIDRQPADRPATEAELSAFRTGEQELVEHAEVPIVNKEARVVEEVSVDKTVEERDEVVRETLRKTRVDIQGAQKPK